VNEGTNIPNLDEALIIQISAQELHLIQRIGRVIRVREGHLGKIYIICVRGTQDEVWLKSALKGISNIIINEWDEKDFFEQIKSLKLAF
jgi:ERCC4-related helicase